MGNTDIVRMHLAQALTRLNDADARDHVHTALTELDDPYRESVTAYPWCGLRGVPSRLDTHDCPNSPIDGTPDMANRAVSAALDLEYVDDHATVSVTAHPGDQDAAATLGISAGDLHVALCDAAATQIRHDLGAIVDTVE